MTTKLKTNWAIRTTDEQFKAYILTLEALGYGIYPSTLASISEKRPMTLMYEDYTYTHVGTEECGKEVLRYQSDELTGTVCFTDISSFLIYHFSSEKTEAEKELEALQEKMNSLQEQIDRVKLSISK